MAMIPTLCRNLVRFGRITPQFMTLECVQQVSIVIEVSLTTSAGGWHC